MAVGSLVVRVSDSRPEGLGSMPPSEYTRSTCSLNQCVRSLVGLITSAGTGEYFPPLQSTCRNCGGGDRGRVAIYRPFGEFRRAKIVLSPVWCSRSTTGVPLAHATMNFVGLDLTTSDRYRSLSWHITFQEGDRFNRWQVIYSQFGLAIHQNDHQARRRFVEWAQNEIAVVPDFHKRILLSDEAHFWLNGYVNKQNCRIWSEANPQVYVETPLHPEKLTVWCALWAGGILLQKR
ncbi:transposable element Tc3 transposase [Trichonephila clavipes]|nr:transposable element Tc3 transposase [Trichonephila clavipes]